MITIQDRLRHPHSAVAFERAAKEAADRIDALENEMARIRELWEADQIESSEQRTQIHQLRAQVETLTKDAERYQWLLNDGTTRFWGQCSLMDPGDVEEAIDAAIAALRKKERLREQIRARKAQKEQI